MPIFDGALSYSSLSSYAECPRKWYLRRRERLPDSTWWATLLGSAVHAATEQMDRLEWVGLDWDLDEAIRIMHEEFDKEILEAVNRGQEVRASGKILKENGWTGGPSKKDQAWCREYGPIMMQRFAEWRKSNGLRIAVIDGLPAVEVPFEILLTQASEGGIETVKLRGYIDRVYQRPLRKGYVVVDIKSGGIPMSNLQLETYGVGITTMGLEGPHEGAFWAPGAKDADAGKVVGPTPLHGDVNILADLYLSAQRGIQANAFPPNTASYCGSCQVKKYCTAFSGPSAVNELNKWREQRAASNSEPANSIPGDGKDNIVNSHG